MGISTEKLVFDTSVALDENSNVGAFLRGTAGALITSTTDGAKERLDTNIGVEYDQGSVASGTDRGAFVLAIDNANNYAPLKVNAAGELLVDASITTGADKAEDSASVSGDTGSYVLSVRQDTLAGSTSTDGDYQSFKTDSVGSLWARLSAALPAGANNIGSVNQGTSPWIVTQEVPNTAFDTYSVAVNTTAGGTQITATPLGDRKRILIQNLGNQAIFIGPSGVTAAAGAAAGVRIAAGGNWEVEAGDAIDLYAIAANGTQDVRIFELS